MELRKTFCRHCMSLCGMVANVEDNRIVEIKGDREHPISRGYSCMMGQHSLHVHDDPIRLTQAQRRRPDGEFESIEMDAALDAIGGQLKDLLERHGPRSIALYYGTGTAYSGLAYSMAKSWLRAIGSPEHYSSMTVDQSSVYVCMARMGYFATGRPYFHDLDVLMLIGNNPVVSHQGWPKSSLLGTNPRKSLAEARAAGTKLIVIDPRRTETAALADIHLQVRPGEDPALLSAMLRAMLEHGWVDPAFCDRYVTSIPVLKAAVEPFTLEASAARTGVPAEQILRAARMFGEARRPNAGCGTGPSFAARSNLAEHLMECMNALKGGYVRAGDQLHSRGFFNLRPEVETVIPPARTWLNEPMLRTTPIGLTRGEFPSSQLAAEILHPGEDRVRALIAFGGNPATAISGTRKMIKALRSLELLVTVDPRWSPTGRLSHYAIPTKLPFEREDLNIGLEGVTPIDWINYSPKLVDAPPGVLEDWEVFYELSRRMGVGVNFRTGPFGVQLPPGFDLDMQQRPTTSDLLRHICEDVGVSYDALQASPGGMATGHGPVTIRAPEEDDGARLDLCPADVAAEIRSMHEASGSEDEYPYLLVSRRIPRVMNTAHLQLPAVRRKFPEAPLYMHPDDIAAAGLTAGEVVHIESDEARIVGVLQEDATLRRGAVAMPMGWGSTEPDDPESTLTSQLISIERNLEAINYMPRQSAIPVRVYARLRANNVGRDTHQTASHPVPHAG